MSFAAFFLFMIDCHSRCARRPALPGRPDRKSTRLNSSHSQISYAVFCLKKKKITLDAAPYQMIILPKHLSRHWVRDRVTCQHVARPQTTSVFSVPRSPIASEPFSSHPV